MTGDVSIKPNSTCMVMTTEILRSMLYRWVALCPHWGCILDVTTGIGMRLAILCPQWAAFLLSMLWTLDVLCSQQAACLPACL